MGLKKIKNYFLAVLLSAYVLPYPGLMPGHKLYRLKKIVDKVGQYWAFGSFARHAYELKLADKKLVEAKTLFEYRQYPLAVLALVSSNDHFQKAVFFLKQADQEGKETGAKTAFLLAASEKHQEVLLKMKADLPKKFVWQPEKADARIIEIEELLQEAIKARQTVYEKN